MGCEGPSGNMVLWVHCSQIKMTHGEPWSHPGDSYSKEILVTAVSGETAWGGGTAVWIDHR